jgi:hypothetical protein
MDGSPCRDHTSPYVRNGSWLRDNALTHPATVYDPVNAVRHGRSEQFFPVGRSGPPLSYGGECWARPGSRSARNGVSTLTL